MVAAAVAGAIGLVGIPPPFISSWALASAWSRAVADAPAAIVTALGLAALGGGYAARFVVRLLVDEDRPFDRATLRRPVHAAAWLGVALLSAASLARLRFRSDLLSIALPLAAVSGAAFAVPPGGRGRSFAGRSFLKG